MLVKELIELLETFDKDMPVKYRSDDGDYVYDVDGASSEPIFIATIFGEDETKTYYAVMLDGS